MNKNNVELNRDVSSNKETCVDSIVLYAKQSGPTSFSSLNAVKHALNTKKVGHTGTLDSFAQGLLVVCVGRLTRLAGNITEFNKSYKAVIKFGAETDTLEYTGETVRTAELPDLISVQNAIKKFTGEQDQIPPSFSAIHVNGKRASDLSRQGAEIELPKRKINVYSAELKDYKLNADGKVEYCLVDFSVSKGTYIRSLARDIANECNSAGHLVGLYRTKVGNFKIEDAAGYDLLQDFTIDSVLSNLSNPEYLQQQTQFLKDKDEEIKQQIRDKKKFFNEETAVFCGFSIFHITDSLFAEAFKNGQKIHNNYFVEDIKNQTNTLFAVFNGKDFIGLLERSTETNRYSYKFVIN